MILTPTKLALIKTVDGLCKLTLRDVLPTTHIMTGVDGRCMCGVYEGVPVCCWEILASMSDEVLTVKESLA